MKKVIFYSLITLFTISTLTIVAASQILTQLSAEIFGTERYLYLAGAKYLNTRHWRYTGEYHDGYYDRLLGTVVYNIASDFETEDIDGNERQWILDQAKSLLNSKSAIKAFYKIHEPIVLEVIENLDMAGEVLEDLDKFERNVRGDFPRNFFPTLERRQGVLDSLRNIGWDDRSDNYYEQRDAARESINEWIKKHQYNANDYTQAQKYSGLRDGTLWVIKRLRSKLQ